MLFCDKSVYYDELRASMTEYASSTPMSVSIITGIRFVIGALSCHMISDSEYKNQNTSPWSYTSPVLHSVRL